MFLVWNRFEPPKNMLTQFLGTEYQIEIPSAFAFILGLYPMFSNKCIFASSQVSANALCIIPSFATHVKYQFILQSDYINKSHCVQ